MRIALIGEHDSAFEPHRMTERALCHSSSALELALDFAWVSTIHVTRSLFEDFHGIWIVPGSPYKDMQKTLFAIQHARKARVPCLGTCGGFQHMAIEFARNELGFADGQHAEYDPYAARLIVSRLDCSLAGRGMDLRFVEGSRVSQLYGVDTATESYYCNFGIHPHYTDHFAKSEFRIVASDKEGECRAMEITGHPFYIGTLYVPQARSSEAHPHPIVNGFLRACHESSRNG